MMRRIVNQVAGTLRPAVATPLRFGTSRDKVVSVEDAVYLIPDGATITVAGFVAQGAPEYVLEALGQRFRETGSPKNLTLLFGGGPGDSNNKGLNHLAVPGLLKRAIGGHYGQAPMLGKMATEGAFEAYLMPMGCVSRMIRCAASGSPGHITTVGFGTLMDPALGGGKLNSRTTEDLVKVIELEGKKYLFYKAIPIDVALVRGTTADPEGNITMERESLYNDNLMQAMAGRSRRGVVIAQVERVAAAGSLHPRMVRVPGTMVDCVVAAPAAKHPMSYWSEYNPAVTGDVREPPKPKGVNTMELDERKVVARRAALEIVPGQAINLGIGIPDGVSAVAQEENIIQFVIMTTEPGVHGGTGLGGHNFGPAVNSDALIEMHSQFDFYNGGGLDACFLGNAETDFHGNVNVTRAGPKLTGPGGFIDISQSTKRVNLMGTFTAGGLEVDVRDGKLKIVKEGRIKKFVKKVKEITFSGDQANKTSQIVNYITERAVFTLTPQGLELIEIAPGVDLEKDILAQMEFKPLIREPLGVMDPTIFMDQPMNLLERSFSVNFQTRLHRCKVTNNLYINLENVNLYTMEAIEQLEAAVRGIVGDSKVHAFATYDRFDVAPHLIEAYESMARRLERDCYLSVRRFSSRSFTRHKIDSFLKADSNTVPHHTLTFQEAFQEIRKMNVMISQSVFTTLFARFSDKSNVITADELRQLVAEATE